MSVAIAIGLLTTAAVYMVMQRGMVRIILGFILASHAANLMFFAAGNTAFRGVPYIGTSEYGEGADPLPQAFVLTAIVIAFAITMYMLSLAITTIRDDDTEDDEQSAVKILGPAGAAPSAAAERNIDYRDDDFPDRGDESDVAGSKLDITTTGAAGAGTGGADASPASPVHDFEGDIDADPNATTTQREENR
ncbi:sodium:proton antiporter [Nesterenkonia populi]|uniref:sodium:proton antiporter n=1 Tax=Nesterenkonia populi TaxID=1591087 RepID=UPI0011BE6541|nr:cation:proton antiporter subunit C [Nesterenkonia populi]